MTTMRRVARLPRAAVIRRFGPVAVILALSSCGPDPPEAVVDAFVQAVNDKDINRMLECIDPRQERVVRLGFRLVGALTGIPVEAVIDAIPGLAQLLPAGAAPELRLSNFSIIERQVHGDQARITASLTHTYIGGPRRTQNDPVTVHFHLRRFEEKGWRIVAMR
jgi:hypothetical protein